MSVRFIADRIGIGLSRKHILAAVDHSLERLGLDYIDLLQCHRFDPETPIEETVKLSLPSPLPLSSGERRGTARLTDPSPTYSIDQMQALHDVVKSGKVRYIGMSSCYAYQCKLLSSSLFLYSGRTIVDLPFSDQSTR